VGWGSVALMFGYNQPLGRAIRAPLHLIPKDVAIPIMSGPNRGLRWVVGSLNHGCWLGTYEGRCTKFVASQVRPGMTAFDVGANVGYYTLLMASRVGPTGRVLAFEPDPANIAALKKHLVLNEINNVEIIEAAVSDQTGTSFFSCAGSQGVLSSAGISVKTVVLDEYPAPDFIKMDIEGTEVSALRGSARILDKRHANWLIALHGKAHDDVPRLLLAGGYSVRWITHSEISVTSGCQQPV
jgi:FkbM family methyltransferase